MEIALQQGKFLRLQDGTGTTVTARAGSVWITEQDSPRDRVLAAGGRYLVDRPGLTLVQALTDAVISLESKPASR